MSVYRQAGGGAGGKVALAAAVALLAGGGIGFLLGASREEEPSLADALAEVQEQVRPALNELELVTIEYGEAVSGGKVVAETEYQASLDHAERAQAAIDGAEAELRLISQGELDNIDRHLDQLMKLIEGRAPANQVDDVIARADAAIRAAALI
jgi:hypothetical protein